MGNICGGNGLYDEKTGCFETMPRSPFKFWKDENKKKSSSHNNTDNNSNKNNNIDMKNEEEEKKQVQKKPPEVVQMTEAVVTKEPPPPTDFSVNRRNLSSNQTSISVLKPPEAVQVTEAVVTKEPQPVRPPPSTDFFVNRRDMNSKQTSISVLQRRTEALENVYSLGRRLGQGKFGTTHLVVEKSSGKEFACKSIAKRKLTCAEAVENVRREIEIMHHLAGHPNVVTIVGAYEDMASVHLVMELCSGGELFDRIIQRGHYSERKAARLIKVIVGVVETCHSLGVMHRDLKPENFLFSNNNEDSPLKAIDFGLSAFFKPGDTFSDVVGSPYYVAPEVLRKRYGQEADVWSAGVILYILLSGVPPFWAKTEEGVLVEVLRGEFDFASDPWPKISELAKDLIRKMLDQNPKKRLSAHEVLCHPWIQEDSVAPDTPLDSAVFSQLKQFLQ